jgi:hypothetical protein
LTTGRRHRMKAALLQVGGLVGLTVAALIEFGAPGALAGLSIAAVYVGLAMES